MGEDLETTLDGCKVAMEALAEDVAGLVGFDPTDHVEVRIHYLGHKPLPHSSPPSSMGICISNQELHDHRDLLVLVSGIEQG